MFYITRHRSGILTVCALFLMMVVLSACGPKETSIDVQLSSYKMDMSKVTASAGDITFHLKNNATDMEHEFVVFKTDLDAGQLPVDADGNVIEDQLNKIGEQELKASESQDLKLNLPAGHYAIVCNQPGHYKQAMFMNFTTQ